MKLFIVYLGGRIAGCHIEMHDVRFVAANVLKRLIPNSSSSGLATRAVCIWIVT